MDKGMIRRASVSQRVAFQRAKLLGERDLLILGQFLVPEDQELVAKKGFEQIVSRCRIERPGQVETDHFCCHHIRKRAKIEPVWGAVGRLA